VGDVGSVRPHHSRTNPYQQLKISIESESTAAGAVEALPLSSHGLTAAPLGTIISTVKFVRTKNLRALERCTSRGDAGRLTLQSLHYIRHVNAVGHDPAHIVFHQLSVDAGFLKLLGIGILL